MLAKLNGGLLFPVLPEEENEKEGLKSLLHSRQVLASYIASFHGIVSPCFKENN